MYSSSQWYLVQCKARESFRAELHLTNQNFTCFHPTYPIKRKIAGRVQLTIAPLFPHYLFVLLSEADNWSAIRSTRGVSKMVRFNGVPASLEHQLVEELQRHCARLNGDSPEPNYKIGDKVVVTDGCFKALEAVVTAASGEERVTLLLNLFNRPQLVELSVSAVAAAG
ncbi:MAG TPA: transcription/translation regulatory transformer protein RfaH [Legionella sp.]|nr:transcription/translation regulatory transformer protein RfaH [Legionella sp.]